MPSRAVKISSGGNDFLGNRTQSGRCAPYDSGGYVGDCSFALDAGIGCGVAIARQKQIVLTLAVPIAAAFLIELTLLATIRQMALLKPRAWIASAIAPYLVLTVPTGLFQWRTVVLLTVLASTVCLWLCNLHPKWDWAFLGLLAVLLLAPGLYPEVLNLKIPTLGRLTWFRLGLTSILAFRDHGQLNFGFWPTRREWRIGVQTLFLIIPVAVTLNAILRVFHFRIVPGYWWKAPGYFFGLLWVVGLSEEVLTRGLLLGWIRKRVGLPAAVVLSSLLFGSAHLWFRGFPNWRFAILAAAIGALYARAYLIGRGVRASTISHAFTVALWKVLFSG
jgi:membrane protease YdiL (CAAX protease family)